MTTYHHEIDALSFQHQIKSITDEMQFRLNELIDSSRSEILSAQNKTASGEDDEKNTIFQYRFTSFLALLQTFRDALKGALGKDFDFSNIEQNIKHGDLMRKLRNTLVHDGFQPIGLWLDGRFYLPVNFKRKDSAGRYIFVDAPDQDVETLALEYAHSYCIRLAEFLEQLRPNEKLRGAQLNRDWFQAAWAHPALRKIPTIEMPSQDQWPEPNPTPPLDIAAIKLRSIGDLCTARLEELKTLPEIPFN